MQHTDRPKGRFWTVFGIVFGCLGLLLVVGLLWFRFWLKDYEATERYHLAERAVSMAQDGYYEAIARKTDVVLAGLETPERYAEAIGKMFEGKTITYSKAFSYDRFEKPIYAIEADGKRVCNVVLKKSGAHSRHGFDIYSIDYFTNFDLEDTRALSFWLPSFITPYVNGQALPDLFVEQDGQQPELLRYAVTQRQTPALRKYTVKGLFSDVTVQCRDEWDNEVEMTENNGVFEAHFTSRIFRVPQNVRVYVNGILLDANYRTEDGGAQSGPDAPLLTGDSAAQMPENVTYRVDYLAGEPEIALKNEAGADVEYVYNRSSDEIVVGYTVYTVYAPKGMRAFANGVELSATDTWLAQSDLPVQDLETILPQYLAERPLMQEYRLTVLGATADGITVEVENARGVRVSVPLDPQSLSYTYTFAPEDPETEAFYRDLALERAKMYSEFVTSDLSKWTFLQQVLPDQPMYDELRTHPQEFYTGHARYWFENEATDRLQVYTENCFSCEISYDHYIADIKTDHDFVQCLHTHIRFWFVQYQGQWYMAEWTLL